MNIALIANDNKKELMAAFCIAYKNILTNHHLFATGTTGSVVSEVTGLSIYKFFAGSLGGVQQIAARVAYNEIDLVIIFRDSNSDKHQDADINSLLRLCDIHNIPFATNIATAELLILGLDRGDMAWRELVNPLK